MTQPWLQYRYKFISTKNIIFASSDDLHVSSRGWVRSKEVNLIFFVEINL